MNTYFPTIRDITEKGVHPTAGQTANSIWILDNPRVVVRTMCAMNTKKVLDNRMMKMDIARKICEVHNFDRLYVPKTKWVNNMIVEERLDQLGMSNWGNMAVYYNHVDKFDIAVKQFLKFINIFKINDLIGKSDWLKGLWRVIPRYDNIVLYIESGIGKIGLIDLEHLVVDNRHSPVDRIENLIVCVILFPFHYDIIIAGQNNSECINALKNYSDNCCQALSQTVGKQFEFYTNCDFKETIEDRIHKKANQIKVIMTDYSVDLCERIINVIRNTNKENIKSTESTELIDTMTKRFCVLEASNIDNFSNCDNLIENILDQFVFYGVIAHYIVLNVSRDILLIW